MHFPLDIVEKYVTYFTCCAIYATLFLKALSKLDDSVAEKHFNRIISMSMSMNRSITISSDVLAQEVSGEMVLLNLKTEQYLGLNEIGTKVWQVLQKNNNLNIVFEKLLEQYDVQADVLENDLNQLVDDMNEAGLVSIKEIED